MSWQEVWRASPAEADVLCGLLEAHGIPVTLLREGAGRAMGLMYGLFGETVLLVPPEHLAAARALCRAFQEGRIAPSDQG